MKKEFNSLTATDMFSLVYQIIRKNHKGIQKMALRRELNLLAWRKVSVNDLEFYIRDLQFRGLISESRKGHGYLYRVI